MQLHLKRTACLALLTPGLLAVASAIAQERPGPRDGGGRQREPVTGHPEGRLRPPTERDDWTLGVRVEVLDTGVRITAIARGSAAEEAGLETDDIIVNVAGFQVGRVGSRLYALESELQRQADPDGRVRLLVQNRRNRQLVNVDVRLRPDRPLADEAVRGLAILPVDARLPRDARIRVRLVRRTLLGQRAYAESTRAIRGADPVRFELPYDPQRVDRDQEYELEVEILSGDRVVYVQRGRYSVNLPTDRVEVRLRRP